MKKLIGCLAILAFFIGLAGCAATLPSSKTTITSPWKNFGDIVAAYEKIIPGKTTLEDLKQMGFDPYKTPNIKILTSTDVINHFMSNPSIKKEDLDSGIQECINAKDRCRAYQINPGDKKKKREGNFWLDILRFKRQTKESGWEFKGLIIVIDNIVVYKEPIGGKPQIDLEESEKKPLGPFQELGDWIIGIGKGFINP
ncbi:MAG: hypothetical protein Q8N42_00150 [bacterium]|nr:hypothetical protein [bacterium]